MKSRTIVCAVAAASLGFGSLSFAQGYDRRDSGRQGYERRDDGRRQNYYPRADQRGFRDDDRNRMGNRDRGFDQREREYGARNWHRGDRIPPEYRSRQYVVDNWRAHRLSPPPRGYEWVQVGGDYVLVAIATGIIAQLLLDY
jgi:Ni/Co efflux regulator RcnB